MSENIFENYVNTLHDLVQDCSIRVDPIFEAEFRRWPRDPELDVPASCPGCRQWYAIPDGAVLTKCYACGWTRSE